MNNAMEILTEPDVRVPMRDGVRNGGACVSPRCGGALSWNFVAYAIRLSEVRI